MKIEMELPEPPEGYEYTGEFRQPRKGEYFTDRKGKAGKANCDYKNKCMVILRKKRRKVTKELSAGDWCVFPAGANNAEIIGHGYDMTVNTDKNLRIRVFELVEEWEDEQP